MAGTKPSPNPDHEADFGSWLETIGFDAPDEEGVAARPAPKRETRRDEVRPVAVRTYPPPPADEIHVYPPLSAHASRTRLKVAALTLGTFASLSIISVLGLAAYLSGLDRHYAPRTVAVEAPAPAPAPAPALAADPVVVARPAPITAPVDPPALEPPPAQGNANPAPAPAPSNVAVARKPRRGLEQRGFDSNPAMSFGDSQQGDPTSQQQPPASGGGMARARVVIHVRNGSEARAQDIAARLSSTVGRLETRRVPVAPGSYEIRFFHSEDSVAARALAEMLPVDGAWRVRDFSQFRPTPSGGTLEVWLP